MEQALQKALAEIITKATTGLNKSVDFLGAQLPDVVRQALAWNFAYYLMWFIVCAIVIFLMTYYNIKQAKWVRAKLKEDSDWFDDEESMIMLLNLLQLIPIVFVICCMNVQWLKIWLAPKIWLIEYAARLVK